MTRDTKIGIVGAGAMGQGIAQVGAAGGMRVLITDANAAALSKAIETIASRFDRLVEKEHMSDADASDAKARIAPADSFEAFGDCDVVVEAVVEKLDVKRDVFTKLVDVCRADAILATNTSSLPIASIARGLDNPERVAGLHFFNPVPLMKLVEVIAGPATSAETMDHLVALGETMGRTPVRVKDSPGFLVNHGGRAYPTEGLHILYEGVASPADIDAVMRECWGFRMGPFELMDLTGLDVNYPVTQVIHSAFGHEPRLRTRPDHALMLDAGRLGRKTAQGFYRYVDGKPDNAPVEPVAGDLPDRVLALGHTELIATLCAQSGVAIVDEDDGVCPILASFVGYDCSTFAAENGLDYRRLVGIDPLGDTGKRVTLMQAPGGNAGVLAAAVGLCAKAERKVTAIADSPGFIGQRVVAHVINLCAEMAQSGLAAPADIDTAMRLGLNYPKGPLAWGDEIGAARVHEIQKRLQSITGDDRYRPSLWLRRRVQLGLSLLEV